MPISSPAQRSDDRITEATPEELPGVLAWAALQRADTAHGVIENHLLRLVDRRFITREDAERIIRQAILTSAKAGSTK